MTRRETRVVPTMIFALCAGITYGGSVSAHQAVNPAIMRMIEPGTRLASNPPDLIEQGRRLFEEETFGGNGRTCASCHPAENNFTIDAAFIAKLPRRDPLFVAEFNPELRDLENPFLMRRFGLILENLDGFDQPGVLRSVPHTLGMRQTITADTGISAAVNEPRAGGEASATGWSHDGSPGDGSLRSFAIGAVIQHFPRTLNRVPGVDFRLPTEAELDAMLAFQLSLGRQAELVSPTTQDFLDDRVDLGRDLFFGTVPLTIRNGGTRTCSGCHGLAGSNDGGGINRQRTTGANHHPNAPACRGNAPGDGGHGNGGTTGGSVFTISKAALCGTGTGDVTFRGNDFFNPPSVIEAADTGPFFHNNIVDTIEQAVEFYATDAFNNNREDVAANPNRAFVFQTGQVNAIAAYLRAINAVDNVRQARAYIAQTVSRPVPVARRTIRLALADTNDAIRVLSDGPVPLFEGSQPLTALRDAQRALARALLAANPNALGAADAALARAVTLIQGS